MSKDRKKTKKDIENKEDNKDVKSSKSGNKSTRTTREVEAQVKTTLPNVKVQEEYNKRKMNEIRAKLQFKTKKRTSRTIQ